jgi:hypothetical protein
MALSNPTTDPRERGPRTRGSRKGGCDLKELIYQIIPSPSLPAGNTTANLSTEPLRDLGWPGSKSEKWEEQ